VKIRQYYGIEGYKQNNWSDIIKTKQNNCLLKHVAIPSDKNVIQKESERKLKHKNLSIEIQLMWSMKYFVISVIIGAAGIVTKGLKKYLGKQYQESIH